MTVPSLRPPRTRRILVGLLGALVLVFGWSGTVSAHTEFASSSPIDGSVVEGPLTEVVVSFTNPASPAGDGFELLDPAGTVRSPTTIDPTDGTVFVLTFDPALTAGTYGVRWQVQAGDAHPIDGAFSFDVTGPSTTAPSVDETIGAPAPATTVPAIAAADDTTSGASGGSGGATLQEFLSAESSASSALSMARLGQAFTFLGTIFGLGALASLVWVIRGRRDELRTQIAWIRLAGFVIAAGGLIQLAALQMAQGTPIIEHLGTTAGVAAMLKVGGGLAVWFGFHERAGRLHAPVRPLSAAVASDITGPIAIDHSGGIHHDHRWTPTSSAAVGLAGYAIVLVSYWFDGHTVSKGPWLIHSIVNFVHLGAAAVWGGGVFAMTTVAWIRRRRSDRTGLAEMVIRFSSLATVSLGAVIVAGLVMAAMILDTPVDLIRTEWGRVLLAKTAVVAVAAAMGGFNHFRLRPALEQRPDDPTLARELRLSLSVESVAFIAVTLLTAWLVASAT